MSFTHNYVPFAPLYAVIVNRLIRATAVCLWGRSGFRRP